MRAYVIKIKDKFGTGYAQGQDCTLYPLNEAWLYSTTEAAKEDTGPDDKIVAVDIKVVKKKS